MLFIILDPGFMILFEAIVWKFMLTPETTIVTICLPLSVVRWVEVERVQRGSEQGAEWDIICGNHVSSGEDLRLTHISIGQVMQIRPKQVKRTSHL